MKRSIFALACLLLSIVTFAQDAITVCHTPVTEKFGMLASNKDFNAQHPTPLPYKHISQQGATVITFKTPDGKTAQGYLIKAKTNTKNWIFVFQEWWGLNDYIKKQSDQLYKDLGNVNVLALDMYDGKVTSDRDEAAQYMQDFKQDRGNAIVLGALTNVAGKDAKIGTIGWCFGGGQSLQAAITLGRNAAGCVIYYGMPEDDTERLKTVQADVLGIFATREKYITPEIVQKFENNMKSLKKPITIKNYDADHGFANPSNPIYDKAATEDAYKRVLEFFRARLK
jgi:carboxymethylenebutenolidase